MDTGGGRTLAVLLPLLVAPAMTGCGDIDDVPTCDRVGPASATWDEPGLYADLGNASLISVASEPADPGLDLRGPGTPGPEAGNATAIARGGLQRDDHPAIRLSAPGWGGPAGQRDDGEAGPVLTADAPERMNRSQVRDLADAFLSTVQPPNGTDVDAALDDLVSQRRHLAEVYPRGGGSTTLYRYDVGLDGPFRVAGNASWTPADESDVGTTRLVDGDRVADVSLPVRAADLPGGPHEVRLEVDAGDDARAEVHDAQGRIETRQAVQGAFGNASLPDPAFRNWTYGGVECLRT